MLITYKICLRYACAIPNPDNDDEVFVTGGHYSPTTVSVYNEAGWQRDMPSLQNKREWHACASFKDAFTNRLVVMGGLGSSDTEVFWGNRWQSTGSQLPFVMSHIRAATIDNRVLLFGELVNRSYK